MPYIIGGEPIFIPVANTWPGTAASRNAHQQLGPERSKSFPGGALLVVAPSLVAAGLFGS
jgi:hypothetical protein